METKYNQEFKDCYKEKIKFWVIGCEEIHSVMWKQLNTHKNACYVEKIFRTDKILKYKICSKLLNLEKKVRMPVFVKEYAYSIYTLEYLNFGENRNFILFTDGMVDRYSIEYLEKAKKKFGLKYVLVYVNPVSTGSAKVKEFLALADFVFAYDKNDCLKYGYEYFITAYSEEVLSKETDIPEVDVFYFGGSNGRLKELWDCWNEMEQNNIIYDFYIVGGGIEGEMKYADKIHYVDAVPYQNIIEKDRKCNCILEVLSYKQNGVTLRTMEAVLLNKKLLTNNKNVVDLPFYDSRYIKVFENATDIDWEWVRKKEEVRYIYNGECSPIRIVEKIENIVSGEK